MAPTFEIKRGNRYIQTHIDVTLTRGVRAMNWRVSRGYNGSDHNTILFETESHRPEPELARPWSRADWTTFGNILKGANYGVPEIMSMKKLDRLVARTYSHLENALNEACPMNVIKPMVGKSNWHKKA